MTTIYDGLAADRPRPGVFLLVKATGDPLRLWAGVGEYDLLPDSVDTEGGVYQGFGVLSNLPVLNALVNGQAQRIDFSLSGLPTEVIRLVEADAHSVKLAPCHIGITSFGRDWQPLGPVQWIWRGRVDTPRVIRKDGTVTAVLSVGSGPTHRRRPPQAYYTGVDQRRRSSDDAFCDRAGDYSSEVTVVWPK